MIVENNDKFYHQKHHHENETNSSWEPPPKKKKKKEKKRKKENERWEEKKKKKIQVELSELVWWIKMWITGERIGNYHCRTHILMDPHNKNFVAKNNLI